MAQLPSSFIPDSFVPDDQDTANPSSFIPDSFVPDEPEKKALPPSKGKFVTKGMVTQWQPEDGKQVDLNQRPDQRMFGGYEKIFDDLSHKISDFVGTHPNIPDKLRKPVAIAADSWLSQLPRTVLDMFSYPESILMPSVVKPRAKIPEVLPPEIKPPMKALPPGNDPYIAGVGGRVQKKSLITPQEEARLAGYEVGEHGPVGTPSEPVKPAVDLRELRERERIKNLSYTEHEHLGGSSLELPDRPLMDIPVQAGDTRLGFGRVSNADLEYPLNIVPEAVRPRSAQTVTRALTGDDFARQVIPDEATEFISATPDKPEVITPSRDLMGGTAAIEPGESILPSAPSRTKVAPHVQEQTRAATGFEDKVAGFTARNIDPVIPDATEAITPILEQNKSVWRRLADGLFVSGEKQLEKMGEVGTELRRVLSAVEYSKRELFNKFAEPFTKATRSLSKEEVENFVHVMDGTAQPMNPKVAAAATQARVVTDQMGQMAAESGVRLKTPSGKVVPFNPVKEYWPHRPVNPVGRSNFIDELIKKNPKLSRSQAERLARQFQNESEWFNSPQHSRMFGDFEWRTDLNAMIDHMADMADIISRARILGPGDIGQKGTMISKLIEAAPDPAYAHELVRTHLRGGLDKNNGFYQAVKSVNRLATKSQVFSKLGLFPISNLNNQLQTMLHGNLGEFVSSFAKTVGGSPTLKAVAKEYGTTSVGDLPVGILSEMGKRNVPVVGRLVKWAEDFARTVATGTGQGTAQAIFRAAKAGDKMAIKRLQNLLLQDDVTPILKQAKLMPEELKFATQRFVELAQQLDSGMKLPPAWVNEPLLHIPLIFKRFGFQGTKSVKDAIMSNPTRNIPLFLIASPLLGELTGDLKSIVYGAVRGAPMPEETLDAIAFELAGRHKFAERITGLESDEDDLNWLVNRLTADMLQSWGLGLVADMLQGALGGKNAGYSALAGPAIDQALSLITSTAGAISDVVSGNPSEALPEMESLGREGLRSIPVVGPGLQRRLLPTPSQEMP